MQASNAPTKVPLPFANAGAKNVIPTASQIGVTPGAASLTDGFPPLTRTPIAAGGVPPSGQDMNGILNLLSANIQWENAGGFLPYDATFSTAIGGYPKGALLAKATNAGFWMSTADNNTTNPDTGGAGWLDPFAGRLLAIRTITSTQTYTPTAGTNNCFVRVQGGGGAGGGCPSTSTGNTSAGLGGATGAYAEGYYPVASLSGQTITIGAAGVAVSGAAGGVGGTTSIGTLVIAPGGTGGAPGQNLTPPWLLGESGNSAIATGGNIINAQGPSGGPAFSLNVNAIISGRGGNSPFGAGGNSKGNVTSGGSIGTGPGAGGSGAVLPSATASAAAGGNGFAGVVEIWEFA